MRRHPSGPGLVVTGTGTAVGKTSVTRGLARLLFQRGLRVAALKPFETGVGANPEDAVAIARAGGRPELAHVPGLYRAAPPLAPFSVALVGGPACDPVAIADAVRSALVGADFALVEGAGGLAVPLTRETLFADFAVRLGYPLVLVARDELGVLSHVIAANELARARGLDIAAVVLTRQTASDISRDTNALALRAFVRCPVVCFSIAQEDDDALATAAAELSEALGLPAETSPREDNHH